MDVSDVVVDYLAAIKQLNAGTQRLYERHLKTFAEWASLQGVTLEHINNRNVQAFLEWLRVTHKPRKRGSEQISTYTIAGYVRSIWTFLYWCLDDEEYSALVRLQTIKGIKLPRTEKLIKQTYSDEEIEALFNACQDSSKQYAYKLRDTAILAVLLDTGIRSEEIRTLTIGNVTLARVVQEDSYIMVMGKGRKQREIPLGNKARRSLHRYIRECRKNAGKSESVFLSRQGGQMSHEALKDMLHRLLKMSCLDDAQVNPHKFRHTFATRYMANGGDIYDLSRLLGHSSVAITENYLKSLSAKEVRKRKKHLSVLDTL